MSIWQDPNGDLHDDMGGAALTLSSWPANQGITMTGPLTDAEIAAARAPTAAQLHQQLQAAAQVQLDIVTGARGQLARCQVAGIAFSAPWQAYVVALRAIINGTDTTSTALPAQPAYIEGT